MRVALAAVVFLLGAGCDVGKPGPSDPCERADYMAYEHEGPWPGGIEGFVKDAEEAQAACRKQMTGE